MGGLLHLVQRGEALLSPLLAVPNVGPINCQCTNHCILIYDGPLLCGFNVAIKWLTYGRDAVLTVLTIDPDPT